MEIPQNKQRVRAKINDVAALAGVSMKTVSRVLNNEPNVRTETRDKVKAAVKSLNYMPDFSARSLAGQKSYLLGMFYDTASEGYLNKFQAGALAQCREYGYHLLVERCANKAEDASTIIVGAATQTRTDGVILVPPLSDNISIRNALFNASIPYVLITPRQVDTGVPSVDMDDKRAAFDLVSHLIQFGHVRIAHIMGHPDHGVSELRYKGYISALEHANLSVQREYVLQGEFSAASGRAAARQLLRLPVLPTAIFAANDEMAAGAIMVAGELGIRVPEDISIVGFDDSLIAENMSPPLTTVRQPIEAMAAGAVDLLIEVARNRSARAEQDLKRQYPFNIVYRKSAVKWSGV